MLQNKPLYKRIPWLKIEHAVVLKIGLSLGFVAIFFVPPEYSPIVGMMSNMVWLWKL